MKKIFTVFLITSAIVLLNSPGISASKCSKSNEDVKKECSATSNYENYVECIRNRMKRSLNDCSENEGSYEENEDDCEFSDCENSCDDCGSRSGCCKFQSCTTNHCCHKTCHSMCRSSTCRSSCRKNCYKGVKKGRNNSGGSSSGKEREVITVNTGNAGGNSNLNSNSTNLLRNYGTHNITTVIHLKNTINNTNLIDVPINLNNSNVNNISVENSSNNTSTSQQNCCHVIEPKTCTRTDTFPFINCYHLRRKQCGSFCRSPTVHKVVQNVCYNQNQQPHSNNNYCGTQIIYVPQPVSSCGYQNGWPYISCFNQQQLGMNCNGCYDHLFNPNYAPQTSCSSSCYNYGVNSGMMYRQGPVLNPGLNLNMFNTGFGGGCGGFPNYFCGGNFMMNNMMPNVPMGMNFGGFQPQVGPVFEQFLPLNITAENATNFLYGVLNLNDTNKSGVAGDEIGSVLPSSEFYGQPITIDEETFEKFKKFLEAGAAEKTGGSQQNRVGNHRNEEEGKSGGRGGSTEKSEEDLKEPVVSTTERSWFLG